MKIFYFFLEEDIYIYIYQTSTRAPLEKKKKKGIIKLE